MAIAARPDYEGSRACSPVSDGYVERDGVRTFYEVWGRGEPTIMFPPSWSLVHSRVWRMQLAYFARHFRVITFDVQPSWIRSACLTARRRWRGTPAAR
jgi:pimeloyl-ACP methyl ester carboxylesterase